MKTIKQLLLSLLTALFAFLPSCLQASHMMGGEITYKWLGNKQYELTMKVYRDCRGIPFNSPSVEMFNASGNVRVTVNYTRTSIVDHTVLCSDTIGPRCSPPNTTSGDGIEEHTFKATVDFAAAPYKTFVDNAVCEVYIKMEQCCRNGAITTITPGNFFVESMMNICNSNFANSSPEFFNIGTVRMPCSMPFKYNFGGADMADNDSLTYELFNPMNGYSSFETYTGNFNKDYFMTPYCPPNPGNLTCRAMPNSKPPRGLYFNTHNGDFVITPTNCSEVAVMSVKVTEYRKINGTWKKLGYVIRDIQLSVFTSNGENVVPEIISDDEYTFTVREKSCFDIRSFDTVNYLSNPANMGNITKIRLLNAPAGSEFGYLDSGKNSKTGRFCWMPHDSDYLQLQNISKKIPLTIEVLDNYCQMPFITRKTVFLKLLPPDSSGYVQAHTFFDRNRNFIQDQNESPISAQLLVEYKNNTFSINTNKAGLYADSFGHGNYRIGPAIHPYLQALKGDTSIQVMIDSSYSLEFPLNKKHGIYGHIYEDKNNNCIFDSTDRGIYGVKVFTDSGRVMGISNKEGMYFLKVPAPGNYTVYCNYRSFEYRVNCPNNNQISVNYSKDSVYEGHNFGISNNADFNDIQVSLNLVRIRRGAINTLKVNCYNYGNKTAKNIVLSIPVPKGTDLKSGTTLYAKGGSTAAIQIDSVLSKETKIYTFNFYAHPDSFKARDMVCFTVTCDSGSLRRDSVKTNNTYKICREVDAPYDPNEKLNAGSPDKTIFDKFINYTVHFQNTGTDTAFRVMVTDTIDTRYLDPSGFELQWSDAPCVPTISGNVLYFVFDEIKLPHLASAGEKSISGFGFRLGLKSAQPAELSFENRASIFFDFEDPVVTKPAVTRLVSPVSILNMSRNSLCQSDQNQIRFKSNIALEPGNEFILELSGIDGSFDNPVYLASKASVSSSDSLDFVIPKGVTGQYSVRMRTTKPESISIPETGQMKLLALSNPNFLINTNINNYQLCENDTLIMDIVNPQFAYKVFRNDVELSPYSSQKSYRFKLSADDKFMVLALDSSNGCTDTNRIVLNILPPPQIGLSLSNPKNQYCTGDTVILKASGGKAYTFYSENQIVRPYSNVDYTLQTLAQTADFRVLGVGENGCHALSDSIRIAVNPLPAKPLITAALNTLSIPYYPAISWYRNDILLSDTGKSISNAISGKYLVKVQNSYACKNESEPYTHYNTSAEQLISGNELFQIYPNPVSGLLYIRQFTQGAFTFVIYKLSAQEVYQNTFEQADTQLDISHLSPGLYQVQISHSSGRVFHSLLSIIE